jgi:SAM-dependent methyltransferase
MHALQVAVVGTDPRMSEPRCGERIDACQEVWRTASPTPDARHALGGVTGSPVDPDLRGFLERLLADDTRAALLCGFDPSEFRDLILTGLEAGRFQLAGPMHRILGVPVPHYGLDPEYSCNPVCYFDDTEYTDEWQREVYDLARELAQKHGWRRILDVGCGSGYKLTRWFPSPEFRTIGVDLPQTVDFLRGRYPDREWLAVDLEREDMLRFRADLIIASDIIEHLADPDLLLRFLASCECQAVLLSTPDAATLVARGERVAQGPPQNPCHVREWTTSEFARYVSGTLELVRQDLYAPNATQLLICRPPGAPAAASTSVCESAQRIVIPPHPGRRTPVGWCDAGASGYAAQSRTRSLEATLQSTDSPLVTVALDPLETATELAPELEQALREGAEIALRAASSRPGTEWSALDGIGLATCERTQLLTALESERGAHGPERALLRVAQRCSKRHVVPGQSFEDPASFLARLEALFDLAGSGGHWPDPRTVMGPAVREALERAEAQGHRALAADLRGFWSAHSGIEPPGDAVAGTRAGIPAADPELAVPLDAGSQWTLVDPRLPDAFQIVLERARRRDCTTVFNLVLPWRAGLPIEIFAKRVLAALDEAGLDASAVAPLVILERPLWSPEVAWLATRLPELG